MECWRHGGGWLFEYENLFQSALWFMCAIEVLSFRRGSDLLSLHQEEELWPVWWVGSSLCTWDARYPDFYDKCHRWPRCQAWQPHRCVRGENEWTGRCYKAPPQRRTLGGWGKCTWTTSTSLRNPSTASRAAAIPGRSPCHLPRRGRQGIPADPCSCRPASGFGPGTSRQSPSQLQEPQHNLGTTTLVKSRTQYSRHHHDWGVDDCDTF